MIKLEALQDEIVLLQEEESEAFENLPDGLQRVSVGKPWRTLLDYCKMLLRASTRHLLLLKMPKPKQKEGHPSSE